jgi:branched-subunit amino acid aminotransferase/4-amino-4-deoxychorismate lyase
MIRFTRSARIVRGKFPQAMQWAKEITEFANKKYKIQMSVYLDSFGEVGTIRWFNDYTDLAALEKIRNQLLADQEYFQRLNQAADLLVQGSAFDTVMHTI